MCWTVHFMSHRHELWFNLLSFWSETYIEIFIFSCFDGQYHRQNNSIYLIWLGFFSWCTVLKKECIFSYFGCVSTEVQKFVGSMYLQWDLEMYDEEMDTACQANTSDLNEELGQVISRVLFCKLYIIVLHFIYSWLVSCNVYMWVGGAWKSLEY